MSDSLCDLWCHNAADPLDHRFGEKVVGTDRKAGWELDWEVLTFPTKYLRLISDIWADH